MHFYLYSLLEGMPGGEGGGGTGKVELRDRCLTNNIFASNGENPFFGKKLTKRSSRLC